MIKLLYLFITMVSLCINKLLMILNLYSFVLWPSIVSPFYLHMKIKYTV